MTPHPAPMECRICSCTEFDPCVDELTGETCAWMPPVEHPRSLQEARPICSFCAALQVEMRQAYDSGYDRPDSDEPLVELATEADLARLLNEFTKGG